MGNGKGWWKCFTGVSQREVTFWFPTRSTRGAMTLIRKEPGQGAESVQVDRPVFMSALGQLLTS
jgi:hypothetical protein